MNVQHFFDQPTSTLTYVIHDESTKTGVVIDPVLDFDPRSGRTSEESGAVVARYIQVHDLAIPGGVSDLYLPTSNRLAELTAIDE